MSEICVAKWVFRTLFSEDGFAKALSVEVFTPDVFFECMLVRAAAPAPPAREGFISVSSRELKSPQEEQRPNHFENVVSQLLQMYCVLIWVHFLLNEHRKKITFRCNLRLFPTENTEKIMEDVFRREYNTILQVCLQAVRAPP